jgi:alkyl hydroperoxide reductase subunit AhpC
VCVGEFLDQWVSFFCSLMYNVGMQTRYVPKKLFKNVAEFLILTPPLSPSHHPLSLTHTQITAFSDRVSEFKAIGCEVVGASIDSAFSHLAWVNTPRKQGGLGKMNIPLLADVTKKVARSYGALVETPGDDLEGVTVRATYIIDPAGIVRHIGINDAPVGRSVDEVLRLVKAFQYVEKHGEVCPANWTEGKKTMIADPVKSQKYFNELK